MAIATTNPTTGVTEKTFDAHDRLEIGRRIATASEAARTMRATTFDQRANWMQQSEACLPESWRPGRFSSTA